MFYLTKNKEIAHLKEYIVQLEKRYAYLRENVELELDKRVQAYEKDAHRELTKEIQFWMDKTEQLRKYISNKEDDCE